MSRSHANPRRTQDQQDDMDSRPPGDVLEAIQANTDEMEVLRIANQRLLREFEELTRHMQRPQGVQQAREGHNTLPHEEQHHDVPRDVGGEGETNQDDPGEDS